MRNHHQRGAKAKKPVILNQKLHDGLVTNAERVLFWQLHHPVSVDPLDREIEDCNTKQNRRQNPERMAEITQTWILSVFFLQIGSKFGTTSLASILVA